MRIIIYYSIVPVTFFIVEQKQLKEGRVYLAHSMRTQSVLVGKARHSTGVSHCIHSQEVDISARLCSAHFLLSVQSRTPDYGMMLPECLSGNALADTKRGVSPDGPKFSRVSNGDEASRQC